MRLLAAAGGFGRRCTGGRQSRQKAEQTFIPVISRRFKAIPFPDLEQSMEAGFSLGKVLFRFYPLERHDGRTGSLRLSGMAGQGRACTAALRTGRWMADQSA
jgi:hypothetical protein